MIISKLNIHNFRNLSGLSIISDEPVKFLIGENGVGKSNIIEMLNIIFNRNSFYESDFKNVNESIIIEITLKLSKVELGYFYDLFELEDPYTVSILAIQDNPNSRIEFRHKDSGSRISYKKIKDIPFVYYSSTEAPRDLDFSKSRTAGKFLNEIVNDFIIEKEIDSSDLVKDDEINLVIEYINSILYHIKFIEKSDISATLEDNMLSLLPRLIELKDSNNISVNDMGSGIKYSSFIYFEILNKVLKTVKQDSKAIITDNEGKKYLPIIIALDEPEIHLHPFMQRNIIRDIRRIITNQDKEFSSLIKALFKIDYLNGELIVATHSPNIISGNYKEYIRLYENDGIIKNKSGALLKLDEDEEKHLLAHAYTIKESFFARSAIIIEGVTELGVVPIFAEKLDCNLDSHSISIISAGGANTIPKIEKLLGYFGIQSICVVDKDKLIEKPDIFKDMLHTEGLEFEDDIVEVIIKNNALDEIKDAIKYLEIKGLDKNIQVRKLKKINKKYKLKDYINKDYTIREALDSEDNDLKKLILICWLSGFKNSAEGRILGEFISVQNIPEVYKTAIINARGVSDDI